MNILNFYTDREANPININLLCRSRRKYKLAGGKGNKPQNRSN